MLLNASSYSSHPLFGLISCAWINALAEADILTVSAALKRTEHPAKDFQFSTIRKFEKEELNTASIVLNVFYYFAVIFMFVLFLN